MRIMGHCRVIVSLLLTSWLCLVSAQYGPGCTQTLADLIPYFFSEGTLLYKYYEISCLFLSYDTCAPNWNGGSSATTYLEGCCGSSATNLSFTADTPICAAGYYSGVIPPDSLGGKFIIQVIPDKKTCAVVPSLGTSPASSLPCTTAVDNSGVNGNLPWYTVLPYDGSLLASYYWYKNWTGIQCLFGSRPNGDGYFRTPVLQCMDYASGLHVPDDACYNASIYFAGTGEEQCISTAAGVSPKYSYFFYDYPGKYGACVSNIQKRSKPSCQGYILDDNVAAISPTPFEVKPEYLCVEGAWNRPRTIVQTCSDDEPIVQYITIGVSFFILFTCMIVFHVRYYKPHEKSHIWEVNTDRVDLHTKKLTIDIDSSGIRDLFHCKFNWAKFWRDMQINHPVISALYPSRYDPHSRWRRILSLFFLLGIHFDIAGTVVAILLNTMGAEQSNLSLYSMLLSTAFGIVIKMPCERLVVYLGRGKPGVFKVLAYFLVICLSFALPAGLIYFCLDDTWRPFVTTIFVSWLSSVSLSWIVFGFKQVALSLFCAKKQLTKMNDHTRRYSLTPVPATTAVVPISTTAANNANQENGGISHMVVVDTTLPQQGSAAPAASSPNTSEETRPLEPRNDNNGTSSSAPSSPTATNVELVAV